MKKLAALALSIGLGVQVWNPVWAVEDAAPSATVESAAAEDASLAALSPEERQQLEWVRDFLQSLNRQTGEVTLANGAAILQVPDNFYFLATEDARKVLEEAWGNPPDPSVLGMLFPAEVTPLDGNAWGVTIQYEEEGYVSDEGASEIDYDELLSDMQDSLKQDNEERVQAGFEKIELVGWAAKPYYDQQTHKLHWAKELKFGDQTEHTLNYNIRVLGRKGVLVLNFIAGMEQLPEIQQNLDSVLAMAEFNAGSRYEEFNPDIDQVAAYGIGALVAGKVLSKAGILAAALIFLKKFWFVILAGLGLLVKRLFNRKAA